MITIRGYDITEKLLQDEDTAVYRGVRSSDGIPIVCKALNKEYPSAKDLSSFRREFEISAKLGGEGTVKVYALEKIDNGLAMIMEDFGGVSLDRDDSLKHAGIGEKLLLASRIASALERLHRKKIIHKDVNPSNILRNPDSGAVKIIDFGISAELPRETMALLGVGVLEGTLPYISPEQTGRMNRPVDCRSDLYSLGVTLYELFTGQLPFKGRDDLELVYCHIAKNPIPARALDPEIPETLSDIIQKLLSKSVESRYQSAASLGNDLNRCLDDLSRAGAVEKFELSQSEGDEGFSVPHRLYGREEEIATLLETYRDVAEGGMRLLTVAGAPGIGKTSLIQEIHKCISSGKAFFISGKFNERERNIPYSALVQAFRELAGQLLCLSAGFLDDRKKDLVSALGQGAGVLLEILPELESIFGTFDPPPALDPVASQNRLRRVLRDFIACFARKDHPVILFLDDLQWGDQSTLDFLRYLLTRDAVPYLLALGAYRDGEVAEGHPLALLLRTLGDRPARACRSIYLKPLGIEAVNQLLMDTLRGDEESTRELASVLYRKTDGNPFFAKQMLNQLHAQGAFEYDRGENRWRWDLKKAMNAGLSDDVIEFLVARLKALPEKTLGILKVAACLGFSFDLKTVSAASGRRVDVPGSGLWEAIEKEIIIPRNSDYRLLNMQPGEADSSPSALSFKFQHDRLHQAVLSLVADGERAAIHRRIGREMLKDAKAAESPETFFELVNHMNAGLGASGGAEERAELAELDIAAGKRAMAVTAFKAAAEYFEAAGSLLSEEEWKARPGDAFSLSLERATSVFLSGDAKRASALAEEAYSLASEDLQRASVSILASKILEFQGDLLGAVDRIRRSLAAFDLVLPDGPEEIQKNVGIGIGEMRAGLERTPIDRLPFLDEMKDERRAMSMRLLAQAIPSAIQYDYSLYLAATLMMMRLTLAYGITPESCKCVADAGIIFSSILGDYDTGYRLGKAGFALIDKLKADGQRPAVSFSFTYVSHMRKRYQEALDYYDLSYRSGMEMGDLQHAAYARAHRVHFMMWVGADLRDCERETASAISFLKESQGFVQLKLAEMVRHFIKKLRAEPGGPEDAELEKAEGLFLADFRGMKNVVALVRFSQYNAFFHFIMGDAEAAKRWNSSAQGIIFASGTDFPVADHYLVQALLLIDGLRGGTAGDREAALGKAGANLAILKTYSDNCPANFAHKHALLRAELSAAAGEPVERTMDSFRAALAAIGKEDFVQMKALINEREGMFWRGRGEEAIGKAFLREAYRLYGQWGAARKLSAMERTYPYAFASGADERAGADSSGSAADTTQAVSNEGLDIDSIARSIQAISSEMKTENLLKILMGILIENAGAQKGCFLLARDDENGLSIEAMKKEDSDSVEIVGSLPYYRSPDLCQEIITYVESRRESVVLDDAAATGNFKANAYIRDRGIKSVLCLPMIHYNSLRGVVYLENNLSDHVFTANRLNVLRILASQAAISIENARLYGNLEGKVAERTRELNEANEKLRELTLIDPLTRLNNRRFFLNYVTGIADRFIQKIIRSRGNSESRASAPLDSVVGVFMLDIDHFKDVNDAWGHAVGDSVLVSISKALGSIVRADDYIVRWGGEEFLIVLNGTAPEYLPKFALKALRAVKEASVALADGTVIKRTCSIGFAQVPFNGAKPDFLSLDQTIKLSDHAMYVAKRNGRNRAVRISMKEGIVADDAFKGRVIALSKDSGAVDEGILLQELVED